MTTEANPFTSGDLEEAWTRPPNEDLAARIEARGFNKSEFAKRIGFSRTTLYKVLTGEQGITPDTSEAIGRVLNQEASYWYNRQLAWDARSGGAALTRGGAGNRPRESLLVDFEIREALRSGEFRIHPALEESRQVQPASVDLTFGRFYPRGASGEAVDGPLVLKGRESVLIESREKLEMPDTMTAYVGCPAAVISDGLLVHTGLMVDPGYEGPLLFRVETHKAEYTLNPGDIIATLALHRLAVPPERPYESGTLVGRTTLSEIAPETWDVRGQVTVHTTRADTGYKAAVPEIKLWEWHETREGALKALTEKIDWLLSIKEDELDDYGARLRTQREFLSKRVGFPRENREFHARSFFDKLGVLPAIEQGVLEAEIFHADRRIERIRLPRESELATMSAAEAGLIVKVGDAESAEAVESIDRAADPLAEYARWINEPFEDD